MSPTPLSFNCSRAAARFTATHVAHNQNLSNFCLCNMFAVNNAKHFCWRDGSRFSTHVARLSRVLLNHLFLKNCLTFISLNENIKILPVELIYSCGEKCVDECVRCAILWICLQVEGLQHTLTIVPVHNVVLAGHDLGLHGPKVVDVSEGAGV